MSISIDLSKQEYGVFDYNKNQFLELKNKNFIFGKNGAGKSTLRKMILSQLSDNYDVRIFTGFNNLVVDKKLNAIVLGEENINAKKLFNNVEEKILKFEEDKLLLNNELKSLEWKYLYLEEGIEKHLLYKQREDILSKYNEQRNLLDSFYSDKARELKTKNNPQITKPNYIRNHFINDIKTSRLLSEEEVLINERILFEVTKNKISSEFKFKSIELSNLVNDVNEILGHKMQEVSLIKELKDDPDRMTFVRHGLKIHHAGENCSFCGNEINKKRFSELETFISLSEVKDIENQITNQIDIIKKLIIQINEIEVIKKENFYSIFHEEAVEIIEEIKNKKIEYRYILDLLNQSLSDKFNLIFRTIEKLDFTIPSDFTIIENKLNELSNKHNNFTDNIIMKKEVAMKKLRLHFVSLKIKEKKEYKSNWRGYELEEFELNKINEELENINIIINKRKKDIKGSYLNLQENTICYLENKLRELNEEKARILKSTKNTFKFVEIINEKLKKVGKYNLELTLEKDLEDVEHYQIKDKNCVRSIDKLSTGEKNIIAFLYFIESLSDVEKRSNKQKVIVFDDPMNSNDDTMQYLIITEIQKIYTDKFIDKFHSTKDYFICLTHNAHFYLNVQPQGYFKEKKELQGKIVEVSKYSKNNFYRLENGIFKKITSPKEDFNTHYELLWIELQSLYSHDLTNSMLNSMRRIVETYTKFNRISIVDFYKNNEEYKKLFDVNSHSIDDHSMETIGKSKDDLKRMFKELFDSNNATKHFSTYWK
ncbi:AAA family ATPase [Exiguobacterium sp. s39]|uniref:AAA family ATPase n=1 Tax=Exiguobacterium sp. s39 TaxID=2751198 RepID=UPI001BEBEF78|nr:AAA family ATPase [Exiguobacterium sp. s39]